MNLSTFYRRYGTAGVARLAERAGVAVSGVRQLIYAPANRPSIGRAHELIKACREVLPDGAECLTLDGLANPMPHPAGSFEVPYWPMREPIAHAVRRGRPRRARTDAQEGRDAGAVDAGGV